MPPRKIASNIPKASIVAKLGRMSTPCESRKDTPPRNPINKSLELPEMPHFFGARLEAEKHQISFLEPLNLSKQWQKFYRKLTKKATATRDVLQ